MLRTKYTPSKAYIPKVYSKLSILMGVISSATLKCTKPAKNTICCSNVNLIFSIYGKPLE